MVDATKFNAAVNAYKNATKMGGVPSAGAESESATGRPAFNELLTESLSNAKNNAYQTEGVSAKSLVGEAELHDLVVSVTNAELTLNTVVAVRDRVISAYQDILKMPI